MSVAHYFVLWMENGKKIPVPGLEHARKIVMGTAITRKKGPCWVCRQPGAN